MNTLLQQEQTPTTRANSLNKNTLLQQEHTYTTRAHLLQQNRADKTSTTRADNNHSMYLFMPLRQEQAPPNRMRVDLSRITEEGETISRTHSCLGVVHAWTCADVVLVLHQRHAYT
ncbi:hypothetical protein BaRGS_00008515 [Batillaria attramentaria]|uniref:Uncharacterized protein n=1 Tax=Batillaria attramentaria TaxID=370345 RepID=A0ABD0LMM5_9CAEN